MIKSLLAVTPSLLIFFLQLVFFGLSNQMVVTFKEENTATFKYLFLNGYRDNNQQAVHTQKELYDQIHFTIEQVCVRACVRAQIIFFLLISVC